MKVMKGVSGKKAQLNARHLPLGTSGEEGDPQRVLRPPTAKVWKLGVGIYYILMPWWFCSL